MITRGALSNMRANGVNSVNSARRRCRGPYQRTPIPRRVCQASPHHKRQSGGGALCKGAGRQSVAAVYSGMRLAGVWIIKRANRSSPRSSKQKTLIDIFGIIPRRAWQPCVRSQVGDADERAHVFAFFGGARSSASGGCRRGFVKGHTDV